MEITVRQKGNVSIVDLIGEMTLYHAAAIKDAFQELVDQNRLEVVLNLAGVHYLDSSGIGVLIAHLTRTRKEGGVLKLCQLQSNVKTLLKLTKLTNLFEIFETEAEALASFEKGVGQ